VIFTNMFRRLPIWLFTFILTAVILLSPVQAAQAEAYRPTQGPIFNNPHPSPDGPAAYRITDHINEMIDHTPRGETIRIATLRINTASSVNALLRAHRRGVTVRIILPATHREDPPVLRLRNEMNSGGKADTSYVDFCRRACYGGSPRGIAHAKIYLFSKTGTAQDVATISSANLSDAMAGLAYNDAHTSVGDAAVYTNMRRYFDGMRADSVPAANIHDQYSMTSGGLAYHYFPDRVSTRDDDTFHNIFDTISCQGATGTAGNSQHRTIVDVSTPIWNYDRTDVARQVVQLHRAGCQVSVLVTRDGIAPFVLQTFHNNGVNVRFSNDYIPAGKRRIFAHNKYIAISGVYGGDTSVNTVFTGSVNINFKATRVSDNVMVRIRNNRNVFDAYHNNFNFISSRGTPVRAIDIQNAREVTPQAEQEIEEE
jgi:phosphatidylserine/phosphatidylglycerophosphate/cardiolipin synthase-like enzyme